jgi:hypothetical protein
MKKSKFLFALILFVPFFLSSCESAEEKSNRLALEEQVRAEQEAENSRIAEELEADRQKELEAERIQAEQERKDQELYNRFLNNSLSNGSTPYQNCFGGNLSCSDWGCSEIKVSSPNNSDVLVTIKDGDQVVRHAYIKAGYTYTFQIPNGTYQPFFYYGKGWNPEKEMPSTSCSNLKGGFIAETSFGKDDPQQMNNSVLTYSLILQQSGNFSTRPSGAEEAF